MTQTQTPSTPEKPMPLARATRQEIRATGREIVMGYVNDSLKGYPRRVRRELARQYEKSQWRKRNANEDLSNQRRETES